jgi:hypothetical protein
MKSILKLNHEHASELLNTMTTTAEINTSPRKFINKKMRVNSAASDSSENQLNYDHESYLKYNDITSFRHKTQLAEDFFKNKKNENLRKKVVASSTSFYEEIREAEIAELKTDEEINHSSTGLNNLENSDEFYRNFIDSLKNRKLNESKLTNLKHYYTKVRYLNRKHSEQRKNDNKISKKLINSIELRNNQDVYESSYIKMSTNSEKLHQKQQKPHDELREDSFFHASQKALFDTEIKMIESEEDSKHEVEQEEDDDYDDEIDEDENEKSTDQIQFDQDQLCYNMTTSYKQQNEANQNTKEYKNESIDVKAIRKYFNMADAPLNLSRKEPTLLLSKSKTKLNLINSQSAPNAYFNSNKTQNELDKTTFYKDYTIYRQNEMKNALLSGGTGAAAIKLKQKSFYVPNTRNRSKDDDHKDKNTEDLTLIATSASTNNLNDKSSENADTSNENNGRFNENPKKKLNPLMAANLANQSMFPSDPSLMLSNFIKLRLSQYSNGKIKPNSKTDVMFIIPDISVKKAQSLKIEGISNQKIPSYAPVGLKKVAVSLKLPSIPNKNDLNFQSETFSNALLTTKSLEQKTSFHSFYRSTNNKRDTNRTPLTISSQLTGSTGIIKPKIVTKLSENVKKKIQPTATKNEPKETLKREASTLKPLENIKIKNKDAPKNPENTNNHLNYDSYYSINDNTETLSKSVGDYKYIASSSSRLKKSVTPNKLNESLKLPEIAEVTQQEIEESRKIRNKISPLKFNPIGTFPNGLIGTLPPIKVNLHVNNEYNYKNFERVHRN